MFTGLSEFLSFHNKMGLEKYGDKIIDNLQSKIETLGLRIPESLQVSHGIKTPSTRVRIRGNKAYISDHGPQTHEGFIAGPYGKGGISSE